MASNAESQKRLNGGNSDNGGLSNVNWNTPDNRNDNLGFRPLIVFRKDLLFKQDSLFEAILSIRPAFARFLGVFLANKCIVFRAEHSCPSPAGLIFLEDQVKYLPPEEWFVA